MAPTTNPAHAGQRTGATMRAIVQGTYGSADALRPDDVDRPRVGPQDELLRVRAAGADTGVWHVMAGRPYLMRVMGFGFRGTRSQHARVVCVLGVVHRAWITLRRRSVVHRFGVHAPGVGRALYGA